jgi:stage V sporulation protein R
MEYDRLKKSHEYGLSKIYEMVINNDPCYAYLLESNSYIDQKIVMCHVSGHNDFFYNNFAFAHTNRSMINEMANHASRIRRYMDWYGVSQVESFIDTVLSLENLIDINSPFIVRDRKEKDENEDDNQELKIGRIPTMQEYMEPYINPENFLAKQKKIREEEAIKKQGRFPKNPNKDVLGFLLEHAPLKRWQADIIDIIRKEAYYFMPQGMTKIMNEGWASYWHAKLMCERVMDQSELIDFADRHSSVLINTPQNLNPYKLGLELFRDIEERWNKGRFGSDYHQCEDMGKKAAWDKNARLGQQKIFEVRKIYSDVTFIDEFLTIDFCEHHGLFTYAYDKRKQQYIIESRDFAAIKEKLLSSLTNAGQPQIQVINGNYENRGELLLEHIYQGIPLDLGFAKAALANVAHIWHRPAHIMTRVDDRTLCLSHDGENYQEHFVN